MTIYPVTYYEFNHGKERPHPLNPLLLNDHHAFYLIDKSVPEALKNRKTLLEYNIDPDLHKAGGKYFGEWSFLLAEQKHAFCEYPFFMISSRFYEKNKWLDKNLNEEYPKLFSHFERYNWGYLPSYDRPIRWIDLSWKKAIETKRWEQTFFPYTKETYQLIYDLFGVRIPEDYRYTADLFCNYIGFKDRASLLEYVGFYQPLFEFFFHPEFSLKRDVSPYVRSTGNYRNEKPFTFLLELISHLFFFKQQKEYFALHYDGYYSVNESAKEMHRLEKFDIPLKLSMERKFNWEIKRLKTETLYPTLKATRFYRFCKKMLIRP